MPEGYGMDLCCSIGGGGGGQSLNQPLDCQLTDWHLFCPILSSMRKFSEPEPAPKVRKPRAEEVFTRRPEEVFLCRAEEVFTRRRELPLAATLHEEVAAGKVAEEGG